MVNLDRTKEEPVAELDELHRRLEGLKNKLEIFRRDGVALKNKEQKLRAVIDQSPDGIVITDEQGLVVEWNRGMEEISGLTKPEAAGRPVWELILNMMPDEYRARLKYEYVANNVKKLYQLGVGSWQKRLQEYCLLRPDGSLRYVQGLSFTISTGEGIMLGNIIRDVTPLKQAEEELRSSEENYRSIFSHANDAIIVHDLETGNIVDVNRATCEMFGYTPGELKELDFSREATGFSPFTAMDLSGWINKDAADGPRFVEWLARRKDGSYFWVEVSIKRVELGGKDRLLAMVRDISERKNAEEKLHATHRQLIDIIEFLPDATFVVDQKQRVIAWNKAIEEMTGVAKEDILGKGNYVYAIPFHGKKRPILLDLFFMDSGQAGQMEQFYERFDNRGSTIIAETFCKHTYGGNGAFMWVKASPLYDVEGRLIGAIESIRDITERRREKEQLKYYSLYDALTGIYNRAYFEQEMRRVERGRFKQAGLIICDLDMLKLVNDALGHDAGDALLVNAARVIRESFRESDMVARIGGDEFAVLLPGSDKKAVENSCRRIQKAIARYNDDKPELPLSISVGYAVRANSGISMGSLFRDADNNMYWDKLRRSQDARSAIVQTLLKTLETRDFIKDGHVDRLQEHVAGMARALSLPESRLSDLRLLAQFHDIGKVGIAESILFKPGLLTSGEMAEMKRHCEIGHRIALSTPGLAPAADWILKHHEWWNGEGYPLQLKGEEIPLECRILAIADAYDAMTSEHPYRKTVTRQEALEELRRCSGTQFDPELVEEFMRLLKVKSCTQSRP